MKPAGLARFGRSQRSRATSSLEYSIEFSNLLDGIAAEPAPASIDALLSGPPLTDPDPDGSLADLVMFPVLHKLEPKPGPNRNRNRNRKMKLNVNLNLCSSRSRSRRTCHVSPIPASTTTSYLCPQHLADVAAERQPAQSAPPKGSAD